jgi:GGDEF domain-containing protein
MTFRRVNLAISTSGSIYGLLNGPAALSELQGTAALLLALASFTLVNHLLVGLVIWLAQGQRLAQSGVFSLIALIMDLTVLSLGAGAALLWRINPSAALLNVIPLYLVYSTLKLPALERKSEVDPKTQLYNARYFGQALEREFARARRQQRPLTVVMADLDHLRDINNTYGHLAGDEVLCGVAAILSRRCPTLRSSRVSAGKSTPSCYPIPPQMEPWLKLRLLGLPWRLLPSRSPPAQSP